MINCLLLSNKTAEEKRYFARSRTLPAIVHLFSPFADQTLHRNLPIGGATSPPSLPISAFRTSRAPKEGGREQISIPFSFTSPLSSIPSSSFPSSSFFSSQGLIFLLSTPFLLRFPPSFTHDRGRERQRERVLGKRFSCMQTRDNQERRRRMKKKRKRMRMKRNSRVQCLSLFS